MRDISTLALSPDGNHLAVGDGPELLVYLRSGGPMWKHFCKGILLGVVYCGRNLVTVDSDGLVVFFRAVDGRVLQEVQLEGVMKGCFASPDGRFAVMTSGGVVVVQPNGETFGYPFEGGNAGGYGPDANSLGLGTVGGFTAMDASNGQPWGYLEVGEVTAVAWNSRGFWMFTAGTKLYACDGGAAELTMELEIEGATRGLCISADGAIAAVLTPPGRIAIVELHQNRITGHVVVRREVFGIDMVGTVLGIGLDDGDASTVELIGRDTVRTEPHPGRGRNNWNLDLSYNTTAVAAAITMLRAGGQPIAEQQFAPEDMPGGGGWCGTGCLVFNLIMLACAGFIALAFVISFVRNM